MRVSFAILVIASVFLYAPIANAQDQGQGRRRRGGDQGDYNQNGGDRGGRFQGGGGFPGGGGGPGGFPGGGGGPGGFQGGGGGPGGFQGGGPGFQGGGGGYPGGGGGPPNGGGGSREERIAGLLQQIDTNHDGQIDENEVKALGQRSRMVESMIRGAGLEPKYPIKISAIQEGMQNARNNWNRGGGPNGPPGASGGNSGSPPGPGGTPANGDSKPAAPAAPLVPGFGVEQKKQAVPGFDVSTKQAATVAASSPAAADAASPAEAPARNPDQLDETIRRHAESILKQNDKDRSGALERDRGEWADVRNAEAIDKDHNGVITLEELTAYYLAENGRHPVKKADAGKKAAAIPNQPDAAPPNSGKTYRILSPTERLPEGLPDWFARNDANGDGQISMSEYTHEWTPEQAAKFAHFDLNGDGIITAEECLQVLKNETKK